MTAKRVTTAVAASLTAVMTMSLTGCANEDEPEPEVVSYESTDLTSPLIDLDPVDDDRSSEYFFLGPKSRETGTWSGRLIVDQDGEPVWISEDADPENKDEPTSGWDLRVQEYGGEPMLTWWEGVVDTPLSTGEVVVVDSSYEEVARVGMGNGLEHRTVDLHETTITDEGTMLLIAYVLSPADLSDVGGDAKGWVWDGVIQEIVIDTGEVLLEWRALDHVPIADSEKEFEDDAGTKEKPYDYFHANSVTVDDDASLLVSARNTHAVYSLDRDSGEVRWTLGGPGSDFDMPDGAYFAWQHDAHRSEDGTITLFDNQSFPPLGDSSRGLRLDVDPGPGTVEVVDQFLPPEPRLSAHQGSFQELAGGNILLGWGALPSFTEYTADGEVLRDGTIGADTNYRAYLHEWEATPLEPPSAVVATAGDGEGESVTVYVSWNGATQVSTWRVLAGEDPGARTEVARTPRSGFETAISVPADAKNLVVQALDADDEVLGSTDAE